VTVTARLHVEMVGRGSGVEWKGEFTHTPTATTGSWAGLEDFSPNPGPGLKLSIVHDEGQLKWKKVRCDAIAYM